MPKLSIYVSSYLSLSIMLRRCRAWSSYVVRNCLQLQVQCPSVLQVSLRSLTPAFRVTRVKAMCSRWRLRVSTSRSGWRSFALLFLARRRLAYDTVQGHVSETYPSTSTLGSFSSIDFLGSTFMLCYKPSDQSRLHLIPN